MMMMMMMMMMITSRPKIFGITRRIPSSFFTNNLFTLHSNTVNVRYSPVLSRTSASYSTGFGMLATLTETVVIFSALQIRARPLPSTFFSIHFYSLHSYIAVFKLSEPVTEIER
jgi:hypothetical protein